MEVLIIAVIALAALSSIEFVGVLVIIWGAIAGLKEGFKNSEGDK